MNWIRENKFLTGFFAVLLAGLGVLSYLVSSSYGEYSAASSKYETQAAELKRLQNLTPFPSEQNLAKYHSEKEELAGAIGNLAQQLSGFEIPEEPLKPTEFQDRLRAAVSAAVEKAAREGVKLPEKFYLSYDEFQTALPKDDAAAADLGRELKAINAAVNQLVECKPEAITAVKRMPVAIPAAPPTSAKPAAGAKPAPQPLVTKRAFDISFVIEQGRLRRFLNALTGSKQPFFVLRNIHIKNQVDKGPPRGEAGVAADGGAAAAGGEKPGSLHFIVGTEKLEVALRLEILDFHPPVTANK